MIPKQEFWQPMIVTTESDRLVLPSSYTKNQEPMKHYCLLEGHAFIHQCSSNEDDPLYHKGSSLFLRSWQQLREHETDWVGNNVSVLLLYIFLKYSLIIHKP